jgi:cytochrome c nitrite reductase small subunit
LPKLLAKAQNGWNHSSRFTLQSFAEPIRITPANASRLEHNCVGCHEEMVSEIFAARSEHRAEDLHCVHCHAGIGHGPRR